MMQNIWIFRVASKPEVGGGHISRCLAIAKSLRSSSEILFVLDEGGDAWIPRLKQEGFDAGIVGREILGKGREMNRAGCLIDGYEFGEIDFQFWRKEMGLVVAIDDFQTLTTTADVSIQPVYSRSAEEQTGGVISGPAYAILDPSYGNLNIPVINQSVSNILIAFGLRDSPNATGVALEALALLAKEGFAPAVTVSLGGRAPHLASLYGMVDLYKLDVTFALDQPGIRHLLQASDLVLGGGGISLLERMAMGRPSVSLAIADNQCLQMDWATHLGATVNAGKSGETTAERLGNYVKNLADDFGAREKMSEAGSRNIDGKGAGRIAELLLGLAA
jgi:spore coat polysaccharide biosynthesis predicted glycosyltransferase SpsG